MNPAALIAAAERSVVARPPPGLAANDLRGFLDRHRARLVALAGAALSSVLLPAHVGRERIITLNLGMGRDSLAMLGLLVEGRLVAEGRVLSPEDIDAVVFADPGAEWSHTLALLPRVRRFCMRHDLRFLHLQKPSQAAWDRYLAELPPPRSPERRAALAERPWRETEPATTKETIR